jgi:hypothetical protein
MSVARQSAICARLAAVEFWHAEPAEETIALVAAAVDELRSERDLEADPSGDRLRSEPCLTSAPAALDVGAPEFVRYRQPRGTTAPLPDWWARSAKPVVYVSFGSVAAALGFTTRTTGGGSSTNSSAPACTTSGPTGACPSKRDLRASPRALSTRPRRTSGRSRAHPAGCRLVMPGGSARGWCRQGA